MLTIDWLIQMQNFLFYVIKWVSFLIEDMERWGVLDRGARSVMG